MAGLSGKERREAKRLIELASAHRRAFAKGRGEVSLAAIEVLLVLGRDGQLTRADLAKALGRDRSAISRAVSELERSRLVSSRPGASPGRPAFEISDAGLRRLRRFLP